MLPLALAQSLHRDPWIERCRSNAHSSARCFHMRGGSLEVGIALDCVCNERRQLRIVKVRIQLGTTVAAAMRARPNFPGFAHEPIPA